MIEINISVYLLLILIVISVLVPVTAVYVMYSKFYRKKNGLKKEIVMNEILATLLNSSETKNYDDVDVSILANDADWCHDPTFESVMTFLSKNGLKGKIRMKDPTPHATNWYSQRNITPLKPFSGGKDVKMVALKNKAIFFTKFGDDYKIKPIANMDTIQKVKKLFMDPTEKNDYELSTLIINNVHKKS